MTESWKTRLHASIPWGSSTNSKASRLLPEEPEVIVRGDGCRVWDDKGREFIDYKVALGPVTLGHRFGAVDDAIRRQLEDGISFGEPHPLEAEVAELFCSLVPGAEQARFLKTGGEANAAAIRLARAFTGRDHVVQIGYNGWLNSLALGAMTRPGHRADHPSGVPLALAELHHQLPWNDLDALEEVFGAYRGQIAAIVVAADYAGMADGATFYPALRQLADREGALLIYDEIVTGFRIAIGGVSEYFGVVPDLAVFAKGLANGMPLSVYTGRKDVLDLIDRGEVVVTSTLAGDALSLAAAKATMTTYRERGVTDHMWRTSTTLWDGVAQLFREFDVPLTVQGFAPCPAIVPHPDSPGAFDDFVRAGYRNGVAIGGIPYVTFSHGDADIAETLDRLRTACEQLQD